MVNKNNSLNNKKEILIFFLVVYGGAFLIGIPFNLQHQYSSYILSIIMMFLPTSGVALAKIGKYKNVAQKRFCLLYLIGTACMLLCTGLYILRLLDEDTVTLIVNAIVMGVSFGSIILMNSEFKILENIKKIKIVFWGFILIEIFIAFLGTKGDLLAYIKVFCLLPPSLFLGFWEGLSIYIGEEYGWRGFLQEIMQKKFGLRWGVVILGIMWELWHIPLWFTQYELTIESAFTRIFLTTGFAVFLGYIYLKTKNVWICSLFHFLNNYLSVGFIGKVDYVETSLGVSLNIIIQVIFQISLFAFLFSKQFKKE